MLAAPIDEDNERLSPKLIVMIGVVIFAVNVVLTRVIDANNVVPKTR